MGEARDLMYSNMMRSVRLINENARILEGWIAALRLKDIHDELVAASKENATACPFACEDEPEERGEHETQDEPQKDVAIYVEADSEPIMLDEEQLNEVVEGVMESIVYQKMQIDALDVSVYYLASMADQADGVLYVSGPCMFLLDDQTDEGFRSFRPADAVTIMNYIDRNEAFRVRNNKTEYAIRFRIGKKNPEEH